MEDKLYDLTSLNKIAGGNSDFINKMIALFTEITPKHISDLKEKIKHNDLEEAGRIAHGMKPSIDQMGIKTLYDTVREIEKCGESNISPDALTGLVTKLDTTINEVCNQLKQHK